MVHHLSLLRSYVEIPVHFVIVERADAGRTEPKRFRGEVHSVTDGAGFKMYIAITAFTMDSDRAFKIADHRERYTGVAGEVLSEAQTRGRDALVATLDSLQLGTLMPEPVYTGF